ncbi:hypothetical protein [Microbacterium sp. NPDC077184]|uniref:hypothetical protein n=1 Tax=Microbacterium sp. NPDC077184 TaxID=3154764 RepID=UPI00342693DD
MSSTDPGARDLRAVLHAGRLAAEQQMGVFEATGQTWHETSITDLLLSTLHPEVKFAAFSQSEEGTVGADWLWWWIDDDHEAFGMLVQAKRLKKDANWTIDFRYDNGSQRLSLMDSADYFNVAAMYGLYLGTSDYRAGAFCSADAHSDDCESCRQTTISLIPALLTFAGWGTAADETAGALEHHRALEEFADDTQKVAPVWDVNLKTARPELVEFLQTPQTGARRIAQFVFERVAVARSGAFAGPSETVVDLREEALFTDVPDDPGHFGLPYYRHVLRGLRGGAPDYVFDVLADLDIPDDVRARVAGIVVVRC